MQSDRCVNHFEKKFLKYYLAEGSIFCISYTKGGKLQMNEELEKVYNSLPEEEKDNLKKYQKKDEE